MDACSRFLVPGQHFHAGVNEWLMIGNPGGYIFRWLLICRGDIRSGSAGAGAGVLTAISGNIGAAGTFMTAVDFLPQGGADQKKMLGVPLTGDGSCLYQPTVHLKRFAPYI
jgi:hypothetical protein